MVTATQAPLPLPADLGALEVHELLGPTVDQGGEFSLGLFGFRVVGADPQSPAPGRRGKGSGAPEKAYPVPDRSRTPSSTQAGAPPLTDRETEALPGEVAQQRNGRAGTRQRREGHPCLWPLHTQCGLRQQTDHSPVHPCRWTRCSPSNGTHDGGPGQAQGGSAGSAWPQPRNQDPRATLKEDEGASGLPAFYGDTGSFPARKRTWNRWRQEPARLKPPPSSPPFTPSDSEFRADKQKQAQNAPDSRLRATSCTQLLPRPRPSSAISGRAPRPRPHHTLEVGERKNREVWRSKPQSHRAAPGEETTPGRRPWTSQCCRREVRLYQDTQLLRPCKCHHARHRAEPTSGR